jgi:hypothetical protein
MGEYCHIFFMENETGARDVFMYLLVVVVLAMSATSLSLLLSDVVNVYLPDPIRPVCAYDSCAGALNTEIAVLLIAFPVLVWAWRFLQKNVAANVEKANSRIRRWLLYLTLFVSGITAIIDLIQLVNSWLGGELTLQFLLKIIIVMGVALSIFYYFLRELHPERPGRQRYLAWGAIVVVAAALGVGIVTSAPWLARDRTNDSDRINALQSIQSQIITYWMAKGQIPSTLADLRDPLSGFTVPVDPQTGAAYEYLVNGTREFTLCATFATVAQSNGTAKVPYANPMGQISNDWDHGQGRVCFDRTIDPQLYPVNPKTIPVK